MAGHPRPQGSKRHVGNGRMVESSKHVAGWRQQIACAARSGGGILPVGPVAVTLDFVMPRPKQTPKRTPPAIKRTGDADKLARAALDAITDVWITDDCLVTVLHITKRIAEPDEQAGVGIRCTPIEGAA